MQERQFTARAEELDAAMAYVRDFLCEAGCPPEASQHILLATEEILANIVQYAYGGGEGFVTVKCAKLASPSRYALWFCDTGAPFDPTAQAPPDVTETLLAREAGGLGIFLVQNLMDKVAYTRENGQNILRIEKEA